MDDFNPNAADDSRNLACPHFIVCRGVRYDSADPDAGHTLERVIVHVRPSDGNGFPFRISRMFLFAQLFGTPGEYVLRIRLLRIESVDGEDVARTQRDFGPKVIAITGENYVDCFALAVNDVWFTEPSVYEFQLWADGFDEPLARERIQARERHMADEPKPQRKERFTLVERGGPTNPSPEELATRVIEPLINDGPVMDPPIAVRSAVDSLLAQLAATIEPLDAPDRAKELKHIAAEIAELARRLAG